MNRTKIEYLDYTWNPIVGCSGEGCSVRPNCWAIAQAKRQKYRCASCYNFHPHFHRERLAELRHLKKPSRIGLNFMGETFDRQFCIHCPSIWREIFDAVAQAPQHTFVILTKQPQNIPTLLAIDFPPNVWLGVSVNCKCDLWRIERLLETSARIKFVSFEPLYEGMGDIDLKDLDWIIIGAQTRPNLQPDSYWVCCLRNEAKNHNIPVFMKNNLRFEPKLQEFPIRR